MQGREAHAGGGSTSAAPGLLIAEANVNMLPGIVGQYRISSVPALLIAGADRTLEPEIYYSMGSVEQMLEYIRRVTS